MFYRMNRNGELEYIDCVLVADKASDRVGAVLFWNPDEETTNVAFYDEDGFANRCGVYAKPAPNSVFELKNDFGKNPKAGRITALPHDTPRFLPCNLSNGVICCSRCCQQRPGRRFPSIFSGVMLLLPPIVKERG